MRVAFVGGTNFVGPVSVRALVAAGHEVAVAHSGEHCVDASMTTSQWRRR